MTTIDAIYRNGAFEPTTPVRLPENAHVRLQVEPVASPGESDAAQQEIYRLLSQRFHSGHHDTAERHYR